MVLNSNTVYVCVLSFCFNWEPIHNYLVSFLFNFKPEMVSKFSMICSEHLREFVALVISIVSSANWDIFTPQSGELGRWIHVPLQFGSSLIFKASHSTARINREGLRGASLTNASWNFKIIFVIKPVFITAVSPPL